MDCKVVANCLRVGSEPPFDSSSDSELLLDDELNRIFVECFRLLLVFGLTLALLTLGLFLSSVPSSSSGLTTFLAMLGGP